MSSLVLTCYQFRFWQVQHCGFPLKICNPSVHVWGLTSTVKHFTHKKKKLNCLNKHLQVWLAFFPSVAVQHPNAKHPWESKCLWKQQILLSHLPAHLVARLYNILSTSPAVVHSFLKSFLFIENIVAYVTWWMLRYTIHIIYVWYTGQVSNWILTSCQPDRVIIRRSNTVVCKWTFQKFFWDVNPSLSQIYKINPHTHVKRTQYQTQILEELTFNISLLKKRKSIRPVSIVNHSVWFLYTTLNRNTLKKRRTQTIKTF